MLHQVPVLFEVRFVLPPHWRRDQVHPILLWTVYASSLGSSACVRVVAFGLDFVF